MFFWGIIINIAPNLGSISVHKSLDIIKSTSIAKNITSDGIFLKAALDLWFKPSNFVPGVIARPEWMINPIFSINIPVCSSKRTLSFFRVLSMIKQSFWYGVIYSLQQMRFTCSSTVWSKYVHWFNIMSVIFHKIIRPFMKICFELLYFWTFMLWTFGNICGVKLRIEEDHFQFGSVDLDC